MTDPDLPSGTDRIAMANREIGATWLINVQADEPVLAAVHIQQLVKVLEMPEMADQPLFPVEELKDVAIDGDTATGTSGEKTIGFVKEDGGWYLSADAIG